MSESLIDEILDDLKKEEVRGIDYSTLGLKFNPFPLAGLPRYLLPPLDKESNTRIRHFIMTTYREGEYGGLSIVGDYGMGKTHILRYIQSVIEGLVRRAEKDKIHFSAVTCFVDRPEDSPQRVVHKIIEDIGQDKIRKYIWKIVIERLEGDIASFSKEFRSRYSLVAFSSDNWQGLFEEPVRSNYLEFLKRFNALGGDFDRLQESVRTIIKEEIVSDSALADRYLDLVLWI